MEQYTLYGQFKNYLKAVIKQRHEYNKVKSAILSHHHRATKGMPDYPIEYRKGYKYVTSHLERLLCLNRAGFLGFGSKDSFRKIRSEMLFMSSEINSEKPNPFNSFVAGKCAAIKYVIRESGILGRPQPPWSHSGAFIRGSMGKQISGTVQRAV